MNTKTFMFHIITLLIVSICITACTQKQTNNLNYKLSTKFDAEKIRPFEESNIEVTFEVINLDTVSNALLSGVQQIELAPNRILVYSLIDGIIIFDDQGNYINSITKGRGPNEIMQATDILYNDTDNCFDILDFQNKLKTFDLDGNYIKTRIDLDSLYCDDFIKLHNNYLFYIERHEYNYCLIDENSGELHKSLKSLQRIKNYHIQNNPFALWNDTAFCYLPGNDIIYSIAHGQDEQFEPYLKIEGLFNVEYDGEISYDQLRGICETNNLSSQLRNINIIDSNIWQMTFIVGEDVYDVLWNKKTNQFYDNPIASNIPYMGIILGTHAKGTIYAIPYFETCVLEESDSYSENENRLIRTIKNRCAEQNYNNPDDGNYLIVKFNYIYGNVPRKLLRIE